MMDLGAEVGMLTAIVGGQRDLEGVDDPRRGPALMSTEHHHPVGQQYSLFDVVGNEDDGGLGALAQVDQLVLQATASDRIQRREGLVHEQHPGLYRQRPGDADTLLLAAGQGGRKALGHVAQADQLQRRKGAALALLPGQPQSLEPERHIGADASPGKQPRRLEHHRPGPRSITWALVQPALACHRRQQAAECPQQCRLADPGGTDDGDELPWSQAQVDMFEHALAAEAQGQVMGLEHAGVGVAFGCQGVHISSLFCRCRKPRSNRA